MSLARASVIALVAAAYGTVLTSLAGRPVPIWFIALLLVTEVTVVNLGIFLPNLSVYIDVVSRGPADSKAVALTFDDGPHPVHTPRVLDALDAVGAKATFFVIGSKADAHPEIVAEIVRRGHEIGLHSYDHDRLLFIRAEEMIIRDLVRTQDAVERAAGVRPLLFRPPVGFISPRTRVAVKELGLSVIGWSARAFDGAGRPTVEQILARVAPSLVGGAIVLLHDSAERGDKPPTSIEALPALLSLLRERGLAPVRVSALMGQAAAPAPVRSPRSEPKLRVEP